jgi:uncharacterized protein
MTVRGEGFAVSCYSRIARLEKPRMRLPQEVTLLFSTIVLSSGLSAAGDLASAQHEYQEKNYSAALQESTPLAEHGNAGSQVLLGRMYLMGQGVTKDPAQAMKWFQAAAVQGNAEAQFLLGSMLLLPQTDVSEGLKWLRLAAEQGMQDAQYLMGKAYIRGTEQLPRDPVKGGMWLRLAAKENKQFYVDELQSAERQMTPDQVAKAKELAEEWKPNSAPTDIDEHRGSSAMTRDSP